MARRERKPMDPRIAVAVLVIVGMFCIVSGILGLTGETHSLEDYWNGTGTGIVEGKPHASSPVFAQVDHTLNYIIPTGHEYYVFILDEELNSAVAVRVSKSWYEKNFNAAGNNITGVTIKGRLRKLDSDVQQRLRSYMGVLLEEPGFYCDTTAYIDDVGRTLLVLRIIEGVLILGFTLFLGYAIKNGGDRKVITGKPAAAAILAMSLVMVVLGIYLMSVG